MNFSFDTTKDILPGLNFTEVLLLIGLFSIGYYFLIYKMRSNVTGKEENK